MEPTDVSDNAVRTARDQRQINEWALVLTAAGIDCETRLETGGWRLRVVPADVARASRVLDAFDRENQARSTDEAGWSEYGPTSVGIAAAVLLLAFHVVTGPRDPGSGWFTSGSGDAARILHGEVWRAVTALTLHADIAHVASNAVFAALFATALCRTVGPGVGLWLILLAGTGGNLLNAALRGAPHSAVGASTAIFGAVGTLGAIQLVRRRRRGTSAWRAWSALAAALALLGLIGTSRQSDIVAHAFGFLVGVALGLGWARGVRRPLPQPFQLALVVGAAMAVILCWLRALA